MSELEFNQLVETVWRRDLSDREQADVAVYLETHPTERQLWQEEAGLSRLLRALPDVPVASNFTSRVLMAVDVEAREQRRSHSVVRKLWQHLVSPHWIRQTAWVSVVVCLGGLALLQYRIHNRMQMAASLSAIAQLASLSDVKTLVDFDAINHMSASPVVVDEELLAALETP